MDHEENTGSDPKSQTLQEQKDQVKKPQLYKVILLNDDYTTMDFVVDILVKVFNKESREAIRIMLNVHKQGRGVCGVYTYDVAVSKTNTVGRLAQMHEFPLKCICEKA